MFVCDLVKLSMSILFIYQLHKSILCFSFQRNMKKLTTVGTNVDGLSCIAGMKVYSMILIILLHRNMFDFGAAVLNIEEIEEYYSRFELTFILNGPILVDSFFTISGFLATYLSLHYYYKMKHKINILHLYIHRYIRMAPTYAVILAFYCTLFVKLGNGPLWQERIGVEQQKCQKVWWANLLFINNYYDTKNYCMFQSWYMACDMNAFLVVPIICLILYKKSIAGVLTIFVLIFASIITVFITVYQFDELPVLLLYVKILLSPSTDSTFLRVYIPGHMRSSSYFVGVMAGYVKYRMNLDNYKIPKRWVRFGWIATVPLLFLSLHISFIFYVMQVPTWFSALYASMHHLCWSLGIAWMLIAISSGYGYWVGPILSWSPLVILSRLTYTVYLCHGAIQMFSSGIVRQPIYASTFNTVYFMRINAIRSLKILTTQYQLLDMVQKMVQTTGWSRTPGAIAGEWTGTLRCPEIRIINVELQQRLFIQS
nr:nose resistant to fluoxetine protein 6-like [Leptinotarsa decemlineata]